MWATFFYVFYLSSRSWLTAATGVPLVVVLSVSLWLIRRSVQGSARMKRLSLITALPPLAIATKSIRAIMNWR